MFQGAMRSSRDTRRATMAGAQALAMIALLVSAAPAAAVTTYTVFTIEGVPGAHVGGSLPQVYTSAEATFSTEDEYQATTKEWVFLKIWGVSGTAEGRWFYVNLAAPPGQNLAVGSYTDATRAGLREPGEPGIDIYGNGAGCGHVLGSFEILEIAFSGSTLTKLAASYEFSCEAEPSDPRPMTNAGEVRYNSTFGYAGLQQLPNTGYNAIGFPTTIIGSTPPTSSITIRNQGTETIEITSMGWSGDDPEDFALTANTCNQPLDPGDFCAMELTFDPTAASYRSAMFEYTTDTYGVSHGVKLSGQGIAALRVLDVQPTVSDFGSVALGQSAPATDFTVWNFGNMPVTIQDVIVEGTDSSEFPMVGQGCPIGQLAAGAKCTISVRFEPTDVGDRTAQLRIDGDQMASPSVVPLSGTGALPKSGISWGATRKAGPAYTWNSGNALARTVSASGQRLHVAYATDRIGSKWAKNTGPYMGIYYVRSTSGSTWTAPKRLNPVQAARLALGHGRGRLAYLRGLGQPDARHELPAGRTARPVRAREHESRGVKCVALYRPTDADEWPGGLPDRGRQRQ